MEDLSFERMAEALRESGGSVQGAARLLNVSRATLRCKLGDWKAREIELDMRDPEIVEQNVRLAQKAQRYMDSNRIERKAFREDTRLSNAVAEFADQLNQTLLTHQFADPPPTRAKLPPMGAVLHWSDQHLNERVELAHNRYDWAIAGKRLRKHVHECLRVCEAYGVEHILVAMTGDLLNSDRRLDELLANAGNRAKASVLAVDLYQQALRELSREVRVTVASVSGNESRMTRDVGWNAEVASDNYDFAIHEMLSLLLEPTDIRFLPVVDPGEMVVDVNGQHVLLLHGHGSVPAKGDLQKAVQQVKGRYAGRGIRVDMVIWGHVHEAHIADFYARSSSLVGTNDYAEKSLGYGGRASQNLYLIHKGAGSGFHGCKFDLQDTTGVEGYSVAERLKAYNTKSARKTHREETVFRVVI